MAKHYACRRQYQPEQGQRTMNENLSLIVMCFFLVASLAFLADQILSYH
jgi:hypothetical protein